VNTVNIQVSIHRSVQCTYKQVNVHRSVHIKSAFTGLYISRSAFTGLYISRSAFTGLYSVHISRSAFTSLYRQYIQVTRRGIHLDCNVMYPGLHKAKLFVVFVFFVVDVNGIIILKGGTVYPGRPGRDSNPRPTARLQ
jgi:hypothetical protein